MRLVVLILCLLQLSCARSVSSSGAGGPSAGGPILFTEKEYTGRTLLATLLPHEAAGGQAALRFEKCRFKGPAIFNSLGTTLAGFPVSAQFIDCIFEDSVLGATTQFMGNLSFNKCAFKKLVFFQNATFLGPAAFRECSFDGDAAFQNTTFLKDAIFFGCHFFTVSLFQEANFLGKVQLSNSYFHANADFTLCNFAQGFHADYAHFMAKADFSASRTGGLLSIRNTDAQKLILTQMVTMAPVRLLSNIYKDSLERRQSVWMMGLEMKNEK